VPRRGWISGLAAALAPALALAGSGNGPQANYALHCAGCHRLDGTGVAAAEVPPLAGAVGWFALTPRGRAYLVRVPGVSFAPLSDAELAELLDWLVPRFAGPAPRASPAYAADEVRALRARPLRDVAAERKRVVRGIASRHPEAAAALAPAYSLSSPESSAGDATGRRSRIQ
jgi:hypothetical protein